MTACPAPAPSPAARKLRLLRDLDEALGDAYLRWPGEPPPWLNELCARVEVRLHRWERWLERRATRPPGRPA